MSVANITSPLHFTTLLKGNTCLIADFYADWCGPCHAIRPMFEKLAQANAIPGHLTFVKVNVDEQADIARQYNVSAMPTFLFFQNGQPYASQPVIRGADPQGLNRVAQELSRLAKEAQRKATEKAQQDQEASRASEATQQPGDETTVSGGYTMGSSGKRSDWKMSLRG